MSSYFKLPLHNPIKFVKNPDRFSFHFDEGWSCKKVRYWQTKAFYTQKWQRGDSTPLICESTIAPNDLEIKDRYGLVVKSISWTVLFTAVNYKIFLLVFNIDDLEDDIYFPYQRVELGSILYEAYGEPLDLKGKHKDTIGFRYYNSYNNWDVPFTLGVQFFFRCEADVQELDPLNDRNDYINQNTDVFVTNANPSRGHTLYIGNAPASAEYVIDILNRIFSCDHVYIGNIQEGIEEKQYTAASGAKIKVTRNRDYPNVGASLDIVPSITETSLEFSTDGELTTGIVTAYDIRTAFFGPGATVPIIETIERG